MRFLHNAVLAQALALVLVTGAACAGLPIASSAPTTHTVRGVLLEVDAVSVQRLHGFTLRTESGEVLTFETDPEFQTRGTHPMSPGHLRQHMALAEPVTVEYRLEGTRRIALSAQD